MVNLSISSQEAFIKACKAKALLGKTAVESPKFVTLLGAKGVGKTTLGRSLENTVLVSADGVIGDYLRMLGVDARTYEYTPQESEFFSFTINAVFVAAIQKKFNIAYDTGLTDNTEELIRRMKLRGYQSEIKAILADDVVAQMNVAKRKLDFDESFEAYLKGKAPYPQGMNPTKVSLNLAAKSATDVAQFLLETSEHFEVYEYPASQPTYDTRTAQQPFSEYLEKFCNNLPQTKVYKKGIVALYQRAEKQNNKLISKELADLYKSLYKKQIAFINKQRSQNGR